MQGSKYDGIQSCSETYYWCGSRRGGRGAVGGGVGEGVGGLEFVQVKGHNC